MIAAIKILAEQRDKQPGGRRRDQILEIAKNLMVDEGVSAVTMRRVAREAGISPGNLHYHFPVYDLLLEELVDWVLAPYLATFEILKADSGNDAIHALRAVLEYVLNDLENKETTMFFPELWVLANRDDKAAQQMRRLYYTYMDVVAGLITKARPDLTDARVREITLFICASIEGQTVFIGYETTHRQHRKALKEIALKTMIKLVMETD